MSLNDPQFQFSQFDYSIELQTNTLLITEGERKQTFKKTDATIASLTNIIQKIGSKRVEGAPALEQFIEQLHQKITGSILQKHSWFGGLIVWAQSQFGFGELGKLAALKEKVKAILAASPDADGGKIQVAIQRHAPAKSEMIREVATAAVAIPRAQSQEVMAPPVEPQVMKKEATPPVELKQELPPPVDIKKEAEVKPQVKIKQEAVLPVAVPKAYAALVNAVGVDGDDFAAFQVALKGKIQQDPNWLPETLKTADLSVESVGFLCQVTREIPPLSRVASRYEQLAKVAIEEKSLKPQEALHMAFFIEARITHVQEATKDFFVRGGAEGLSHSVQFDWKKHEVYVIADPEKSSVQGGGSFKRVAAAARLAFHELDKAAEVSIQLATTADNARLQSMSKAQLKKEAKAIQKSLAEVRQEIAYFTEHFRDVPGIAEFYTVSEYTETINGVEIPRLSILFKAALADLQKLIKHKHDLATNEQVHLAKQLFAFFALMHQRGFVHGDIKGENILIYSRDKIGVTDFGMAFAFAEALPRARATRGKRASVTIESAGKKSFNDGMYGTLRFTAPELLGTKDFAGDFPKTDSWALGCVLYGLYFQEPLPWERMLHANREICGELEDVEALQADMKSWSEQERADVEKMLGPYLKKRLQGKELSSADIAKMDALSKKYVIEKTKSEIESALSTLAKARGSLTQEQQYERLIYQLLRLDPEKRLSMEQAANEIALVSKK